MQSPFQCGGTHKDFPKLVQGFNLFLRVENLDGAQVNLKIDGTPSATSAEFYLLAGEAMKIDAPPGSTLSIVNIVHDPFIYWGML